MEPLFLDFETYYDGDYSLRHMTPPEYIADGRFEALGCSFIIPGRAPFFIEGPDLPRFFQTVDWSETFAISHNALFDMLILSMRYKVFPFRYGDTLAMARNWISHSTGSVSLAACAKYYGLPDKWDTINKTRGISYAALIQSPALHQEVRDYAIDDALKCQHIFTKMMEDGFPVRELDTIDMVIRMAALPEFVVDKNLLALHAAEIAAEKEALLKACGMDNRDNLMRDEALAALLLFENVTPPMKVSKTTGQKIYAFAKSDKDFTDLLENSNPMVQALVAARLGHKSTIEQTRTQRLISIANVCPELPIPLKYSGAHTHRFSGDWSINAQNLPNGSNLRRALKAPPGKVIVSVDASQIEARLNAALSGQDDLLEAFKDDRDVYSEFAERVYRKPVNKVDTPKERFVGKTGVLSLGYGSSAPVFQNMCRVKGNVNLTIGDASDVVTIYRMSYKSIVANWNYAGKTILPILGGRLNYHDFEWGPLKIKQNKIILPNGNALQYRDLAYVLDEQGENKQFKWMFKRGDRTIYTYGAKLVENVIQSLAFVHIMEVAWRVAMMTGYQLLPKHQVHDELIYIVEERLAPMVATLVVREMATSPTWMPYVPLSASFGIGPSYGDAH
jgi:DNA polymerase